MTLIKTFILISLLGFLFFEAVPNYVDNHCNVLPNPVEIKFGLPWKEAPCDYKGLIWGKSVWEMISKFASPKIPSAEINFLIGQGCISYFDGCNKCKVSGGHSVCTQIICEKSGEPRCLEYK